MTKSQHKYYTKKDWETIQKANQLKCRTCNNTKELSKFILRKYEYPMWETECRDCLNQKEQIATLERKQTKGLEWNIKKYIVRIKRRAKSKEIEFDLDIDYLVSLWNKQNGLCWYTKREMNFTTHSPELFSLDRKDSNLGYTKDNVIWCCWTANNIKADISIKDLSKLLIDICRRNS